MPHGPYKSGVSRDQFSLLPARVEDYVSFDNPVRAIEAYVSALDLVALGFRHANMGSGAGQPPYDPGDLLKLYIYGYVNRVRSSRRLSQEAGRNLEVLWLLRGLQPGYRTIAKFRSENAGALKAANRDFVVLSRELGLIGGELVAIDGSFFHGDASKDSIRTRTRLKAELAAIDRDIEAYAAALDAGDAADAAASRDNDPPDDPDGPATDPAGQMAALMAARASRREDLARLEETGETQISRTDKDARLLNKNGQTVAGYNVQCAIDSAHKLILASAVVNDGNDTGQLHTMARAAAEAAGVDRLCVLADSGYYNGSTLKACEEDGIEAFVPVPERTNRLAAKGRITHDEIIYDPDENIYRCPNGAALRPMSGLRQNGDKQYVRYASRKADCRVCPLKARCLSPKSTRRDHYRWIHEEVLDRHRARMKDASARMRQRACLAEHPFGTLKCRAGYRHFLVRGFRKVSGEWSLMALCYNFSRVLNIIGLKAFRHACAV
jgi:transposase